MFPLEHSQLLPAQWWNKSTESSSPSLCKSTTRSPPLPCHLTWGKSFETEAKLSCTASFHTKGAQGNRNICIQPYSSACPRTMQGNMGTHSRVFQQQHHPYDQQSQNHAINILWDAVTHTDWQRRSLSQNAVKAQLKGLVWKKPTNQTPTSLSSPPSKNPKQPTTNSCKSAAGSKLCSFPASFRDKHTHTHTHLQNS